MKKLTLLVGLLALLATPVLADGALVAYWNFNSNNLPGGGFGYLADPDVFPLAADAGIGNGTLSVGGGIVDETILAANGEDTIYRWVKSFTGYTQNALFGDPAGGTIAIEAGPDLANNGSYITLAFDMTDKSGLSVSYVSRGTSTGYSTQTWSYSVDGAVFTDFQTVEGMNNTTVQLVELLLLDDLDGVETAFLRLTFSGATGSSGNNRIDNIVLMVEEAVSTESKTLSTVKSLFR